MIEAAQGKQLVMYEMAMFDELITSSPQTTVPLTVPRMLHMAATSD
jgi:hypothetical protein